MSYSLNKRNKLGNVVIINKLTATHIIWLAVLGPEEDILEHLDKVQVSEKVEHSELSKYGSNIYLLISIGPFVFDTPHPPNTHINRDIECLIGN